MQVSRAPGIDSLGNFFAICSRMRWKWPVIDFAMGGIRHCLSVIYKKTRAKTTFVFAGALALRCLDMRAENWTLESLRENQTHSF
jgi:hypothetical protein